MWSKIQEGFTKLKVPDKHNGLFCSQQLRLSERIHIGVTGERNERGELGRWPSIEADVSQLGASQAGGRGQNNPPASQSLSSTEHSGESQAPQITVYGMSAPTAWAM